MSLTRKIIEFVTRGNYRPVDTAALAAVLKLGKADRAGFLDSVQRLLESGRLRKSSDGTLRAAPGPGMVEGLIKRTNSGIGFLIPHRKPGEPPREDILIGRDDLHDAVTGDEARVQILRGAARRDGRLRGYVVEVLSRASRTFVGTYFEKGGLSYVRCDGTVFRDPIYVGDPGAKGARPDDKVVVDLLRFPSQHEEGEGVITRVLGPRGTPGVDTRMIIAEFNLPEEFDETVLAEARNQAELFDENNLEGRLDLTNDVVITIDPVDAHDFDDAISLHLDERGHWFLGVHVADVAHFVQRGTPLDDEAYRRATSVYLPDRVIPMLPEVLSNGLASLQAGRVRLTKTVLMEFDPQGVHIHTELHNSAIRVAVRFAYEQVMPIIREPEKYVSEYSDDVLRLLARMHQLAMKLRGRRLAAGSLELTMPEVRIDLDKDGGVAGAHLQDHDASHQIIEEFMLAANMAVAGVLNRRGTPFLRRVHADPDELKLRNFAEFVGTLGYPLKRYQSRTDLQQLLNTVADTPHRQAVNFALLRSMKQAEYSPEAIGHFALAVQDYCHFTSPIRRYPDLTVHRLVDTLIRTGRIASHPSELDLMTQGAHCSNMERRAQDAERELTKLKLLAFLRDRVGDEFAAVITGVQEFGFFCQLADVPAEGLVHSATFDDDLYDFDATAHVLTARRGGRLFRLGDRVNVVITRVDIDRRQLELAVAGSATAKLAARGVSVNTPGRPPAGGRPGSHAKSGNRGESRGSEVREFRPSRGKKPARTRGKAGGRSRRPGKPKRRR